MNVAFVLTCLEPYGGHIAVLELAERLVARGHEVSVVYPRRSVLSRRNRLLRPAGRALPGGWLDGLYRHEPGGLGWFDFSGTVLEVPDLDDSYLPRLDAVVATAWQTAERVARFGPRSGARVYFIQGYETWGGPRRRVDATWRLPFVRVVPSAWLRDLGRERFGLKDLHVVPQGVDLERFWPDPPPRPPETAARVGFLHHPGRWKGLGDLREALALLGSDRPVRPVSFGLFPPGPDLPPGTEYHLRPTRAELRRIYSSLDVFVCPSRSESGPLTVAEAMACGTCVVSTDVGNVSLWSAGGEGAVLVPRSRPEALVGALEKVLNDPRERGRIAERGRELIREFTWERSAAAFERVLEDACHAGLPLRARASAIDSEPGAQKSRSWVVYLSAIAWEWGPHRQQELAGQLARTRRVLFVEPLRLRPSWRLRCERLSGSLWQATPPTLLPLGRFLPPANDLNRRFAAWRLRRWLGRRPGRRLLWIDEDLAAPVIGRLGETARVYDAADLDWTFTRRWNRWHLRRALASAVERADLVLTSSRALVQPLSCHGAQPVELLNACDPSHFRPEGPEAAALVSVGRPRLGYVGALDERAFDAPLIAAAARLRPAWSFVLVGHATPPALRLLRRLPNVHLLGPAAYEEVPSLLRGFDVCLIPYRAHGRAGYVHPKKLYEYLAVGKPVVSTCLPALAGSDAPHHRGATPDEFVEAVEAALAESGSAELEQRRREVARRNSWDSRGEELRALLDSLEGLAA